jgi:hypothetical protein
VIREPLLCYVAAPFSATTREGVEENIRRAESLGVEVAKLGVFPVVPHSNTAHPDYERVQPYKFWIAGTMTLLRKCDIAIFGEGWDKSSGAKGELLDASRRGQLCFFSIADLQNWLYKTGNLRACELCSVPIPVDDAIGVCGKCIAERT